MDHETLSYHADGLTMKSELFRPPGDDPRAGVLVFPEAYGLNAHALARAARLTELGYVALACDLHGEGLVVEDLNASIAMLAPLYADPFKTRARAAGGLLALAARLEVDAHRIGAIGFCFGGTMGLELARSGADIKAVVGFHSGLATVAPLAVPGILKARVLVCIGADDPFIRSSERAVFEEEMRSAEADWQMNVYGNVVRSFTNPRAVNAKRPDAVRYSPEADHRSWQAMQNLFTQALT